MHKVLEIVRALARVLASRLLDEVLELHAVTVEDVVRIRHQSQIRSAMLARLRRVSGARSDALGDDASSCVELDDFSGS